MERKKDHVHVTLLNRLLTSLATLLYEVQSSKLGCEVVIALLWLLALLLFLDAQV